MYIQNNWNDFRLFMKNLIDIEVDIVKNGYTYSITISDYVIYKFNAYNVNDFCAELNRFKLAISEKHITIHNCIK